MAARTIGVLKEIKTAEKRVSLTPAGAEAFKRHGHTVLVELNAGGGSGFTDEAYVQAGAEIVATPAEIFERSYMVMHVKEPQPSEYPLIREGQVVFTYLHLAAARELTEALLKRRCVGIAYETVQRARWLGGWLPRKRRSIWKHLKADVASSWAA